MSSRIKLSSIYFIGLLLCASIINATPENDSNARNYKNISFIKAWLKKRESCSVLLREKRIQPNQYENVVNCYIDAVSQYYKILDKRDDLIHFVANKVLTLDLSEKLLTKMVEKTANGSANQTKIIKKLVKKGALTSNIHANQIMEYGYWSAKECETVEFIIDNNKGLNKTDIFYLTYTGGHHSVCVKAVEKFIEYNPEIINQQNTSGDTPLHKILFNRDMGEYPKLALKLMSVTNVNMRNLEGNTALHEFILNNHFWGTEALKKYQEVIDQFVSLGIDLDLKNNNGITIRELLVKYSLNTYNQ